MLACYIHSLFSLCIICIVGCLLLWCPIEEFFCHGVMLGTLYVFGCHVKEWVFHLIKNAICCGFRLACLSPLYFCCLIGVPVASLLTLVDKYVTFSLMASFIVDLGWWVVNKGVKRVLEAWNFSINSPFFLVFLVKLGEKLCPLAPDFPNPFVVCFIFEC